MKFTAKTIGTVRECYGKADHIEWDDEIPGFGLRIRESGSRNWIYQYQLGKKQRRMTLGTATAESFRTIKDRDGNIIQTGIRERIAHLQAKVKLGEDPAGKKAESKQRAAETFDAIGKQYLVAREPELQPATYDALSRNILLYCKPLHGLQFAGIEQRTIATRLNEIKEASGAVTANRVRASLSALWGWAMQQGIATQNPVANTGKNDEAPRERVLTDGELREVWDQAGDDHYGSIIRLLTLTGQRADEMASLRRSEIGRAEVPTSRADGIERPAYTIAVIDLPGARTKNGRRHLVPLSAPVLAILARQPVRTEADGAVRDLVFGIGAGGFGGWSKGKERLDRRIHAARVKAWEEAGSRGEKPGPMPHWTPHDLRRTLDTVMNDRLGIAPHVVEAILNHVSSGKSGKSGVAGVYNHALYLRERAEALNLWADHVMAAIGFLQF
jgi:integrase